jgi:hypothetical protein
VVWVGVCALVGGIALESQAFRKESRYPSAPPLLLQLKITKSDRRWAWRYRLAFGLSGLILMFAGLSWMAQGSR